MQLRLPKPSDIAQKKVLVRVDFNVPLEEIDGRQVIEDDKRLKNALPTIQFLLENKAQVILISHLGRPDNKFEAEFSLEPVRAALQALLGNQPVALAPDCVGPTAQAVVNALQPGQIVLLENLRFHPEEEANDAGFAKELASHADVFINEAFSTCHRAHASTEGVTHFLPSFAGLSLAKEVAALTEVRDNPQRPLVVVIGGAKISDKVEAVVNLAHKADAVLIGGGVANNFLKADGLEIHKSFLQDAPSDLKKEGIDYVNVAQDLLTETKTSRVWLQNYIPLPKILYPLDVIAAPTIDSKETEIVDLTKNAQDTPDDKNLMYLDIGPRTTHLYQQIIKTAGTIFWNGPMGVFEEPQFASGTELVAKAIAERTGAARTIIGGGETIAAAAAFGLQDAFTYTSTAGGASLEFLAGKELPGLKPLMDGVEVPLAPSSDST
jgi:phosphoglycerate kinase